MEAKTNQGGQTMKNKHGIDTWETQHTPTPWKVDGCAVTSDVFNICTLDTTAKDMNENQIGMGELSANAAFIVRAVNTHEELLETLKTVVVYMDAQCKVNGEFSTADAPGYAMRRKVEQAIAKAEGRE
jgi:hypothetical protein